MPLGAIQAYLASVHGLRLSLGGIVRARRQVARVGQQTVTATLAAIRASPVVHADETGWREGGVNRCLWSFSTPTERYYTFGRREKGIVDQVLGPDFSGVLVSDFYAAYDHYDGLQQKCWVHLLRDIHALTGSILTMPGCARGRRPYHCAGCILVAGRQQYDVSNRLAERKHLHDRKPNSP